MPLHLRIFLSSPGDVGEERQIARNLVEALPEQPLLKGRVTLEIFAYDNPEAPAPMSAGETPQASVNRYLGRPADCDLTIVVLWSKLGTPLPPDLTRHDGTRYESGTVWELEDARQSEKEIWIYRRTEEPVIRLKDPDFAKKRAALEAVESFFSSFANPDGSLAQGFNAYSNPVAFRALLEKHLEAFIRARLETIEHDGAIAVVEGPTRKVRGWLESRARVVPRELGSLLHLGEDINGAMIARHYLDVLVRERERSPNPDQHLEQGMDRDPANKRDLRPKPLSELAIRLGTQLLVIGEGGTGKTTMLRKLELDSLQRALGDSEALLPIYVRLSFFDSKEKVFDALIDLASRGAALDKAELYDLWDKAQRSCLFLFDGLNEVRPELQPFCRSALQELMLRPKHCYVVTSRPGAATDELMRQTPQLRAFNVLKLEEDQVRQFFDIYGVGGIYDRLGQHLQALAGNPFLLWAIAQSCAGLSSDHVPNNIGQLYARLIDAYIFGRREKEKPELSRPTRYDYDRVKKPILGRRALQMCKQGTTRLNTGVETLTRVQDHLHALRQALSLFSSESQAFMPDPSFAMDLLGEAVQNGILKRIGEDLEFTHQSVRDYFAATELAKWPMEEITNVAPTLVWRHLEPGNDAPPLDHPLAEALVMVSGLLKDSSDLVLNLNERHPLLAAECLRAASRCNDTVREQVCNHWMSLLSKRKPRYPWLACHCLGRAQIQRPDVEARLVSLVIENVDSSISTAAAATLGLLGTDSAIGAVVAAALDHPPDTGLYADLYDPLAYSVGDLRSDAAVRQLFEVWCDAAQLGPRVKRAERLLASIGGKRVRRVLSDLAEVARTAGDERRAGLAASALGAFDAWKRIGLAGTIASIEESSDLLHKANLSINRKIDKIAQQFVTQDSNQVIAVLRGDTDELQRAAAAQSLGSRAGEAVSELVESAIRDAEWRVREACLSSLRALRDRPELLDAWRQRVLDHRWAVVFEVPGEFAQDLNQGVLSDRWRSEFHERQLELPDDCPVLRLGAEWYVGDERSNEGPPYRVHQRGEALEIIDSLAEQRLLGVGGCVGVNAVPVLEDVLKRNDPFLDCKVVRVLGEIGDNRAAAVLVKHLAGPVTSESFWNAITALAHTRDPKVIAPLLDVLGKLDAEANTGFSWSVSYSIEEGRKYLPSLDRQVEVLIGALKELGAEDNFRQFCEKALGVADESRQYVATHAMRKWISTNPAFDRLAQQAATKPSVRVREQALPILAVQKTDQGREILTDAALGDPEARIREAAAKALRQFDDDLAIQYLIGVLGQSDVARKVYAAQALALIDDESALLPLEQLLPDPSSLVRVAAATALNALGYESTDVLTSTLIPICREDEVLANREQAFETLKNIPGGKDALYAPIRKAMSEDDAEEVLKLIGEGPPFLPKDANLYYWRAVIFRYTNRAEDALRDLDEVIHLEPEVVASVYVHRAEILSDLGRRPEALADIRKAAEIERDSYEIQARLASCAYEAGEYEEAVSVGKRALDLNPSSITAAFQVGLALLAMGKTSEAQDSYRRGIAAGEDSGESVLQDAVSVALDELAELRKSMPDREADITLAEHLLENLA